jgi:hypothetical protein
MGLHAFIFVQGRSGRCRLMAYARARWAVEPLSVRLKGCTLAARRARQNRRNRHPCASEAASKSSRAASRPTKAAQSAISPALYMSFRAPAREEWRPRPARRPRTPREAPAFREPNVWQSGVFQSSAAGLAPREMARWALEKAPVSAIIRGFFNDFPRVFPRVR